MVEVYNRKTKQNSFVSEEEATELLTSQASDYLPIPKVNYKVIDPYTSEEYEVDGDNIYSYLGKGFTIKSDADEKRREQLRQIARDKYNPVGQFAKNFTDEAVTFGAFEEIREGTANPLDKEFLEATNEEFFTSELLGGIAGWTAGLIGTGGGSLLGRAGLKGAGKVVGKVAGALPTSQLIKGSHKAGVAAGQALTKGIQGEATKKIIKSGAYGLTTTAIDSGALGLTKAGGELIEDVISGENLDIIDAAKQGVERFGEIAKYSAFFHTPLFGLRVAKEGLGKLPVPSAYTKVSNTFSEHLRKVFFNAKDEYSVYKEIQSVVIKNKELLKDVVPDDSWIVFWNKLEPKVKNKFKDIPKNPSAKTIKEKVFDELIKNNDILEGDALFFYEQAIRHLNKGKIPVTQIDAARKLDKASKEIGKKIGDARKKLGDVQKKSRNELKNIESKSIINIVSGGKEIVKKDLNRYINKRKNPKDIANKYKETREILDSDYIDLGISVIENKINLIDDIKSIIDFPNKINNKFGKILKTELKKLGLDKDEVIEIATGIASTFKRNQSKFSTLLDVLEMKKIIKSKTGVNQSNREFFEGFIKRYGEGDFVKEIQTMQDLHRAANSGLDERLFVDSEQLNKVFNKYKLKNKIKKIGEAKPFYDLIDKTINVIKNKKITIDDLNDIRKNFDDMAQFDKTVGSKTHNNLARKLRSELTTIENELFEQLSKIKGLNIKSVVRDKRIYSIIQDIQPYVDDFKHEDFFTFGRAGLIAGGIFFGGPLGAVGAGAFSFGVLRGKRYFLRAADIIDRTNSLFKRASSNLKSFSNESKMISVLKKTLKSKSFNLNEIGKAFYLGGIKNLSDFSDQIEMKSQDHNYFDQLSNEVYPAVNQYGGDEGALSHTKSMAQTIQMIKQLIPKGSIDSVTGRRVFSNLEEMQFQSDVNILLNPTDILNRFKSGTLTQKDLVIFQSFYPKHYQDFITNSFDIVQNGKIKLTPSILSSYNMMKGIDPGSGINLVDSNNEQKKQNKMTQLKQGGVQFSTNQETEAQRLSNQ